MTENFNMTFSTMQNGTECYAQCYGSINGQEFEAESNEGNLLDAMMNVIDEIENQIITPKQEEQKKKLESMISDLDSKQLELEKQLKNLKTDKEALEKQLQKPATKKTKKKTNDAEFNALLQKLFNF